MKFKYLGTAAAEGWPAVFCRCENCERAKKAGGPNIRTRSQALINDDFLIDFPSDTNMHMLIHNIDLSAVKYLIVTHSHNDHFAPIDLFFRSKSYYAHNLTEEKLYLYSNEAVLDVYNKLLSDYPEEPTDLNIIPSYIPLYTPTQLGKYTVTALKANHKPSETAYVYLISDGDRTVLYLNDTGSRPDQL